MSVRSLSHTEAESPRGFVVQEARPYQVQSFFCGGERFSFMANF